MNNNLFSMAVITLLCASCSSDLPEMVSGNNQDAPKTNLEYALDYAENFMKEIDPQTRCIKRKIENIQYVCSDKTRGLEQDTTLYLINYSDDMGFALLDADAKNGGIYAISPTGHLEFSDSIDNPMLAHFFQQVKNVSAKPLDPVTRGGIIVTGWAPEYYHIRENVMPFLMEQISHWTCDEIPGVGIFGYPDQATTSSVVLAKMLAFFNKTVTVLGNSINCNAAAFAVDPVHMKTAIYLLDHPAFLNDITISPGVSYISGDSNRKVTPQLMAAAFSNLNFNLPYINYNDDAFNSQKTKLLNVLRGALLGSNGGEPVVVGAKGKSKDGYILPYYQYWIIDGFVDRYVKIPGAANIIPQPLLYHCVWGKDSYHNGYYAFSNSRFDNTETDPFFFTKDTYESQSLFPNPQVIGGFIY